MARLNRTRHLASERGAELIELAIALPLLLFVLMGIVDFAFMFQRYLVLTNAAMEGARVAVLPGYSTADAQSRVAAYAAAGGVPGVVTTTVTMPALPGPNGGAWPGVSIRVTHDYQFQFIGPIAGLFGGSFNTVTLAARSTVRAQLGS